MDYKNLFEYKDGMLIWREDKRGFTKAGCLAGSLRRDGYIGLALSTKYLFAHRVVWEMHYGEIPEGMLIDHINGDRSDNRIDNLRLCTTRQNAYNRGKTAANKSGFKGVCWHKQKAKWVAQITIDGKNKFLGFFTDPEEAYIAYCEVALTRYGEFARL